ncbi:MAG: hypothetical protein A2836_01580 [Candidatus Taylorbacteria bacterium RIFCSPHIGHO2_01_FULL_45_63]|uniref:Uncharacterized protein n=1 Tax=Candidatus Taylorbacteria bacterium RIFCSPHIGHO2_02_FULL_45_35 TaxID=1802311 RepID=A0A1G2MVN1_9BACT|nr:MAG: hypothetical protein A2836_01580 [Candidatus Taylorbacteria bacterium RIFCSPHIGHO2_01_FULL_45_63]OHA27936.1 MAG: hypothetical protein A3D56_03205 [Candidatus Taylorbacteria bacterium RIFCSPHIGHO2_02_FULL_45_35]OHA34845.1 MAG: hypothetical protein A3A22_01180 [Candidatus Taylorbacteria bacterium RIFCSPLOWO2_01_FULL_45_34b]
MENENIEKLEVKVEEPINKVSALEKIAFVLLLLGGSVSSLFFFPSASFPFQFGKGLFIFLAVLGAAIMWLIARLKEGRITLPTHFIFGSVILILLINFISSFTSGSLAESLLGSGFDIFASLPLLVLFVFLGLTAVLFRSKNRIFSSYLIFVVVSAVIILFHVLRLPFLFGPGFLSFGLFTNTVSNLVGKWNDLSIFFALGTVLSLVTLELLSLGFATRFLFYAVFGLALVFLVIVNFTVSWIVLGIFSLVLTVYLVSIGYRRVSLLGRTQNAAAEEEENANQKTVKKIPVLPLVVFVISLIMLSDSFLGMSLFGFQFRTQTLGQVISNKLQIFQIETRPSWGSTYGIAKTALKKDPLFGVGSNRFVKEWLLSKPAEVNNTVFWSNDFNFGIGVLPTFVVTTGLLGVISWALFFLAFLGLGLKALLSSPGDRFARYLSVSSFFTSLMLWVFALLYVPSITVLALAFFFTGLFLAALSEEKILKVRTLPFANNPKLGFVSVLVLIVLLVGSVVLVYIFIKKFSAALNLQKAVAAYNVAGDIAKTEEGLIRSVEASPNETAYRFLSELSLIKTNQLLSGGENALGSDEARTKLQGFLGDAQRYAQAALDLNRENYQNWIASGRVYEILVPLRVDGAYANAKQSYEQALIFNPHNPEIYLMLARLEVANRDNKKARVYIADALKEKNNYTEAIFFLSQIEASEGNLKAAISSVESAALISPNEPVIQFQLGLLKYNSKDYKGAATALERAVALNSVYANAKYFLGLSYEKLGRIKDATAQFEDVKKTNPDNKELDSILKNLKAGRPALANTPPPEPEKRATLPVKEEGEEVAQ